MKMIHDWDLPQFSGSVTTIQYILAQKKHLSASLQIDTPFMALACANLSEYFGGIYER